jgi:hypothetical protein
MTNINDLRHGLTIGAGLWVAFTPEATDDQVRELCKTAYGWTDIVIQRDAGTVRARPRAIENLRRPHPEQAKIDALAAKKLVDTKPLKPKGGKP